MRCPSASLFSTCSPPSYKTVKARYKTGKARYKTVKARYKTVKARYKTVKATRVVHEVSEYQSVLHLSSERVRE